MLANSLHLVFSAECNEAMTWQSIGLFHSHKHVKQPGNITRLLACSEDQLKKYGGLDAGPTFVHHNMRFGHPLVNETGIPNYNKPASVMFFLEQVDVKEEYIALLDADMVLREPLDPIALGARPGVVVSAEYSYLVGTDMANATHTQAFAKRFLDDHELPLMVRCGGFHIFHREDIRRIAPLWVDFTRRVRDFAKENEEQYLAESFLDWNQREGVSPHVIATRRKQGIWQAEMYGYVFGAARVGVSHIVRRDVMLYPGYVPMAGTLPQILHYGSDYKLDRLPNEPSASSLPSSRTPSDIYFNKMNHVNLDAYAHIRNGCNGQPFFFDRPPPPRRADGRARSRRDLLCIEHLQIMNAALCDFYSERCGEIKFSAPPHLECPVEHEGITPTYRDCRDQHALCAQYARSGECEKNPQWMLSCADANAQGHGGGGTTPLELAMRNVAEAAAYYGCSDAAQGLGKGRCLLYSARITLAAIRPSDGGRRAVDHPVGWPGGGDGAEGARGDEEDGALAAKWQEVPLGASGLSMANFGARFGCRAIKGALVDASSLCHMPAAQFKPQFEGSVLLATRGHCTFAKKARLAEAVGGVALLIFDPDAPRRAEGGGAGTQPAPGTADDHTPLSMSDDGFGGVSIPVVGVSRRAGELLRKALEDSLIEAVHEAKRLLPEGASHAEAAEAVQLAAGRSPIRLGLEGLEVAIKAAAAVTATGTATHWDVIPPMAVEWGCSQPPPSQQQQPPHSTGVVVSADGRNSDMAVATEAVAAGGDGPPCVGYDRSFYIYDRAFSDEEWELLVQGQRCDTSSSPAAKGAPRIAA